MLLEQEQDMSMEGAESRGDLAVMATIIGSFWIRYMRRTCELFDHDLTMAYILGEIGVHNVSHMHAKPSICQSLPQHLSAGTLSSFLKPCNAYSIAEATGMPRETVRRKIVRLEELGWVTRVPEGGVVVSRRCIDHTYETAYPDTFFELLETYSPPILHSHSRWLGQKRYWYLLNPLLVLTPLFSSLLALYSNNGLWLWATVPFMYLLMPLLDMLVGQDPANPSDAEMEVLRDDAYYVNVLYLATAMHWVTLLGTAWIVGSADWHWLNIIGAGMSVGCMNGAGLATGHELGHKVSDPKQSWGAKIMVACCGYAHFMIEHNKGHHKDVSTPEDPASSRFGESIYTFVLREIPGAARRAWKLESERLARLGLPFWSRQNEILQSLAITLLAYGTILALWGVKMLPFLALSVIYGWWTLTCANYVEHYGLLRQKEANGRYERCAAHHSWNSNFKLSNLALLHLQRHSDHHAHPTRPYQVLRDMDNVPQLPGGYPGMFVLAMWPMAWFAVMDKRVLAWAGGDLNKINIDPDRREEIFRRYQQQAQ